MEDVNELIKKRGIIKGQLTRFQNWVDSVQDALPATLLQLSVRLPAARPLLSQFDEIQYQIESLQTDSSQVENNELERDTFETAYYSCISIANDMVAKQSINQPPASVPRNSIYDSANQVKLPTINLPSFNGDFQCWLEFRDTYVSLIHSNGSISNSQKFHYLRASLKGEASNVLHSLELCDSNYLVAWESLLERYDNKRLIVHNHIKSLFNLPCLSKESHGQLRQLLDGFSKHLRSLKAIGQPVDNWDTLLIYIFVNKLDATTKREWESQKFITDFPKMQDLREFLKSKCELLETLNLSQAGNIAPVTKINNSQKHKGSLSSALVASVSNSEKQMTCVFCKQNHTVFECQQFKALSVQERGDEIRNRKLCINCLKGAHYYNTCRSYGCKICRRKHHTLLHFPSATSTENNSNVSNVAVGAPTSGNTPEEVNTLVHHVAVNDNKQILLSTAIVRVQNNIGDLLNCRMLLDSGSQSNFITTDLANKLGLQKNKINLTIMGISQLSTKITHSVEVKFYSNYDAYQSSISCIVVPQITGNIPSSSFDLDQLNIPPNIKLADNDLNTSRGVDLLIGSEIFYHLLCAGQIKQNGLVLQKTRLGWIVGGPLNPLCNDNSKVICNLAINSIFESKIQDQLAQFWQIEEGPMVKALSREEKSCEDYFINTTTRDADNRFVVSIPLKESVMKLGNSLNAAVNRFYSLERKLLKNLNLRNQYIAFMREYETMGHMTKIANPDSDVSIRNYYLPHHGVIKEESITTKLRVVFDGSAKSDTGVSLNDIQMVGPVLQEDLFSILIRFRKHKFVITADVAKMYRQVLIQPAQRDLQRIVWRESPSDPLSHYTLNTITYGTAAASFLAIRCLQQLAHENAVQYPRSSSIIIRDFYVDDGLMGANTIEEAIVIREEISEILQKGCFELRKWVSNEPKILQGIHNVSDSKVLQLGPHENTKTLGLVWLPSSDQIGYDINIDPSTTTVTKRQILSNIAKIFDPLGILSPCIITVKIILQKLWQYKLSWDESIPLDLHTEWLKFQNELNYLSSVKISRCILISNPIKIEMHGFSDASENAYGACLYIKSLDALGNACVKLLCAKSKVAPIKRLSIPRLELCGALLLCKLLAKVHDAIDLNFDSVNYWCDSTVVLAWIKTSPSSLKPFVANRIAEIQDLTSGGSWRYVASRDNPADLVSRGVNPRALLNSAIWWDGPTWLFEPTENWPIFTSTELADCPYFNNELRPQRAVLIAMEQDANIFDKFNSLTKIQRCVAYWLRFKSNALKLKRLREIGSLSVEELGRSLETLLKMAQIKAFKKELLDLKRNQTVDSKSNILSLNPFLDEKGIIRVGGRLGYSNFNRNKKHPYLLPRDHQLTMLIMEHEHITSLHCGPQALLASVRENFWPISGRNTAKKIVRNCITCFRANPRSDSPLMGPLPKDRVTPTFPFNVSGVDYCGPILIKTRGGRGGKSVKAYICIFVCFAVKAIHLELVADLTTEAFMAALRRFIARRGKPSKIYSDNGTNFVGADAELKRFLKGLESEPHSGIINDVLAAKGISWHFIPPRSPHFGGLWEAGVKSVKVHLRRVVGNALLTYEQLYTTLTQIEAVVNSRPLTPLSSDPNDPNPLTPSHFLIGRSMASFPEPDLTGINECRLSKFQRCLQISQHFWTRWSKEYVSELQQRSKWQRNNSAGVKMGDMVIIREDNVPPLKWHLGRVVNLHPGSDGIVRVVTLKTVNGLLKRSVNKVCVLPNQE